MAALEAPRNSWYPKRFFEEEAGNEPYLSNSLQAIQKLIDAITEYIPQSQIYLMGFSQGACLALEFSARHAGQYGGIIALTGSLIGDLKREGKYQGNFEGTPIFIGTCEEDPHIPLSYSEQSEKIMHKLGAKVFLKISKGCEHTIRPDEIEQIKALFFKKTRA